MQILHPFAGSVTQYAEEISDPDRYRPDHCPQCEAKQPLTGHGFYCRTLVDLAFDGVIQVRRYLCRICKRTVSLLPEFALPWLRFRISVIALFLVARLLKVLTLATAAPAAGQSAMPYQLALFRYGLIAPLVIERLPRGELTRRAQEIAAPNYDLPHQLARCHDRGPFCNLFFALHLGEIPLYQDRHNHAVNESLQREGEQ